MKTNKVAACLAGIVWLGTLGVLAADQDPPKDRETRPPTPGYQEAEKKAGEVAPAMVTPAAGQTPTEMNKASRIIGMEVQNDRGERLGTIKDIVLDLEAGSVSYCVLSSGGILGVHEKLLAVPTSAFTRSIDQKHLVLHADKENIARAEGLGKEWPSVQNPTFGAMPFWQNKPGPATEKPVTSEGQQEKPPGQD